MTVFLTSSPSGSLDDSHPVDGLDEMNGFAEQLRQRWKPGARCLIIAASPESCGMNDGMAAFFAQAMERAGLSGAAFDVWDARLEWDARERIFSYDVILLGGGHVPTQQRFFGELQLRELLAQWDGMVIGISAGTMNSAETVYAQPELPGESVDPDYQRFLPGLGLTQTMILPHYQMVKDDLLDGRRLYEDITYPDSHGREFLVLPDGSYLLIEDGHETVFGEAWRLSNGCLHRICGTDQSVLWR